MIGKEDYLLYTGITKKYVYTGRAKKHDPFLEIDDFIYPVETYKRTEDKPKRNAPCPCGCGQKTKKCKNQ